jgi:LmbE family N-acetylglucosaminyl deacetylase
MTEQRTVMCVVAHPADMVTECGGTLALHSRAGDRVVAVILTHGGRIHPVVYVEESRKNDGLRDDEVAKAAQHRVLEIKHAEIESAAAILGIHEVNYLDHDDNIGVVKVEMIDEVAESMLTQRPTLLVTQHPGYHATAGNDHCIAGQVAIAAATKAAHLLSNLDSGKNAHFVKQTFFFGGGVSSRNSLIPGGGPINDVYVDITSVVTDKIRAMDQFVSQGYDGAYSRKCVAGHNGHWGSIGGVTYAEAFMRANAEVFDLLPLAERSEQRDEHTMHRAYSEGVNPWDIPVEPSPSTKLLRK